MWKWFRNIYIRYQLKVFVTGTEIGVPSQSTRLYDTGA
jgi:hypothetical protein